MLTFKAQLATYATATFEKYGKVHITGPYNPQRHTAGINCITVNKRTDGKYNVQLGNEANAVGAGMIRKEQVGNTISEILREYYNESYCKSFMQHMKDFSTL